MINLEKEKLELTEEFVLLGITFNIKELSKITDNNFTLKFPKMKKVLRQWKRRKLAVNGKIVVFKSLISSMITHILLSLPIPSQVFIGIWQICEGFSIGWETTKIYERIS